MNKTNNEIIRMIYAIKKELEKLPERNVFGDSNDEERDEMREDLIALQPVLENPNAFNRLENYRVRDWLTGKFSTLEDYQ